MDKKMSELLVDQWNAEIGSAVLYHEYAAIAYKLGMPNLGKFLKVSGDEELEHANRFFNYMLSVQVEPKVNKEIMIAHKAPKSALEMASASFEHEKDVTAMIHKIQAVAYETNDYRTIIFNSWFVTEQIEEEDKWIKVAGLFNKSNDLLAIDQAIGEIK